LHVVNQEGHRDFEGGTAFLGDVGALAEVERLLE